MYHRRYHPDCSDMSGRAFDKSGGSVDRFDKPDKCVIIAKLYKPSLAEL